MARGGSDISCGSSLAAGRKIRIEYRVGSEFVYAGGSKLFCVPPMFLGGSLNLSECLGRSGIDRADQLAWKSRGFRRAADDGISGDADAFVHRGIAVSGGKSVSLGNLDAGGGRRPATPQ